MASACVNNISVSPERFPATKYGWLSSRISFSRELQVNGQPQPPVLPEVLQQEPSAADFEFRLEDPVTMLPADELFSDGKLVPLHLSYLKPSSGASISRRVGSPDVDEYCRRDGVDPYLFSPKAPRCSSRWRELLGMKKSTNTNLKNSESLKTTSYCASSSSNLTTKSLKNFVHRNSRSSSSSSSDASLSLPLLKDSDCESVSISSSRLSLSSSSSGHDHDDLPRLSLDSDKPAPYPFKSQNPNPNPPRMRLINPASANSSRTGRTPIPRTAPESGAPASSVVSVDSPRMNSSGKIVFQSLERSSSSPSSFHGGPRFKHRGMERSYSANVRVTPVLNVPVCSLRGSSKSGSVFGFSQLFSSPQKRDSSIRRANHHQNGGRNRPDRT